ncbi:MAG TPA: sugar ABC transporter permease [Spirochaetales bacterium]|nr:sugar ABC transporter permease [Spirochaetales bacterium]HRY56160.1 sugar ABC transporter permease [Spirochaetia bacterium]HRZ65631.1 sugar ABC transporter permease [Spirochaetia bacterium]
MGDTVSAGRRRMRQYPAWVPYAFIAPSVLIFALFIVWPALNGFYQSVFTRGIIVRPDIPGLGAAYVGLANYERVLGDERFLSALGNTLLFSAATVPLIMLLSLALALVLQKRFRGVGAARAVVYWPSMISFIMVGIAWKWILNFESGIANYLLGLAGSPKVGWLVSPSLAMASIVGVSAWASAGFYMVMYIGGLNSIPEVYYEAALIDGASSLERFRYVTLPLLRPTILLVMVLATINCFKVYQQSRVLTAGGPGRATVFLVQNIYEEAFKLPNSVGYASAQSALFFLVMLALTLVQLRLGGRDGEA